MYNLIERYMVNLNKNDINNFAASKNIVLNEEELNFTYEFIKKNWKEVLSNPNLLDLDRYQNQFDSENFNKIKKVFKEYLTKYSRFL